MRIAGLVIDGQHRVTKTGRNFGSLTIEDFTGKTEIMLWSDDYVKFQNYLDKGMNLLINGFFKQRYNSDSYEFKVTSINLLETAKQNLTRNIELTMHPAAVSPEFVQFLETNVRKHPGRSSLRFHLLEPKEQLKVSMFTAEMGFTMNDEMAHYLLNNPDVDVHVGLMT
jgi:DNA polymerase-3 subunit alpha